MWLLWFTVLPQILGSIIIFHSHYQALPCPPHQKPEKKIYTKGKIEAQHGHMMEKHVFIEADMKCFDF